MKHTQTNHCSHGDDDDANIVPIYKPPDQRSRVCVPLFISCVMHVHNNTLR